MDSILFVIIFVPVYALLMFGAFIYGSKKGEKEKKEADERGERDWLTKEEAEAFIGENSAYYLARWKDRPNSFFKGWNWTAAFFCVEWLAYRKMYGLSVLQLLGLRVGFPFRRLPVALLLFWGGSQFLDYWIAALISIFIGRFIGGGLFGNMWIREAAVGAFNKSIRNHPQMSERERVNYLKSRGGTNAIAPVVAVIFQIVGLVIFILAVIL